MRPLAASSTTEISRFHRSWIETGSSCTPRSVSRTPATLRRACHKAFRRPELAAEDLELDNLPEAAAVSAGPGRVRHQLLAQVHDRRFALGDLDRDVARVEREAQRRMPVLARAAA